LGNDKGQIGNVFLYLSALIVIVALIFLAGKLINGLSGTACDATDVQFQRDFRRALDAHNVIGSRANVELQVPCDARQLCLVDGISIGDSSFISEHASLQNAIRTGVKRNVFLIREQGMLDLDYDERIIINRDPNDSGGGELCIDAGRGLFSFNVEGFGRFIKVTA